MEMKEVVIIKMVNKKPTEIFFLSNCKWIYKNISRYKKDILLIRRALTGKFNVIVVRTNSEERNEKGME